MSTPEQPPHIVHFSSVHQVTDIRVFIKECRSLAKAGYRVTLVARGERSDDVDGVRRIAVANRLPGGRIGRMVLGTSQVVLTALRQKADLYHFHDPELLPFGLLMKLMGKKVVYDAHENIRDQMLSKPYLPVRYRPYLARIVASVEDFAIRRFDGVVTATPKIAQTLHTPHTMVVANYPVTEEILQGEENGGRDSGKVLFVGGYTTIRGAEEMVEAIGVVNQVTPARLVICGTMPDSVRAKVEALPGWQFVEDMGWQSRRSTQHHMATAACGLCVYHPEPNHVEALPNKLFEYMAAGLPVVASSFPFWAQFVEETGAGVLVDPLDPHAIAYGITRIIGNSDLGNAMGIAGKQAVVDKFNWDAESSRLIALYGRLLGQDVGG